MYVHRETRGTRARIAVAVVALVAMLAVVALSTRPASAGTGSPVASAAAKKCPAGKVRVRRPGRSSVCAKPCPAGTKRKVSRKGRVSCVKRRTAAAAPAGDAPPATGDTAPAAGDAPPTSGDTAPPPSGPAQGGYSGQTEQSRPVTFTVSGGEVTNFEAGVNTYCTTQGNQRTNFDAIADVPPMAIGPDGSFSYTGDETNGNIQISGRVVGNSATGTVGMNRGDTNYSGGMMYFGSCSASDVSWSAAAS